MATSGASSWAMGHWEVDTPVAQETTSPVRPSARAHEVEGGSRKAAVAGRVEVGRCSSFPQRCSAPGVTATAGALA